MTDDEKPTDAAEEPSPDAEEKPAEEAAAPAKNETLEEGADAVFEALWKRVLEAWDDDKPHQAVLAHALEAQRLPDLAGRYRKLKDDPEKAERAEKKINAIVVAATQMLMAMKTPARTKTPWQWTVSVGIVCAIVCAWLFYRLFVAAR